MQTLASASSAAELAAAAEQMLYDAQDGVHEGIGDLEATAQQPRKNGEAGRGSTRRPKHSNPKHEQLEKDVHALVDTVLSLQETVKEQSQLAQSQAALVRKLNAKIDLLERRPAQDSITILADGNGKPPANPVPKQTDFFSFTRAHRAEQLAKEDPASIKEVHAMDVKLEDEVQEGDLLEARDNLYCMVMAARPRTKREQVATQGRTHSLASAF